MSPVVDGDIAAGEHHTDDRDAGTWRRRDDGTDLAAEDAATTEPATPPVPPEPPATFAERALVRLAEIHPAAWLTFVAALVFAAVFGWLGVEHHRNFGTWAFDMGIYDQAFWLVSRGQSWVTVRGIDFWGHHLNLIAFLFAPFYWLGAGPEFLYVVQAMALAAGAIPTYLLARDRLANPWIGFVFAFVYLMYAPIQWIAWANFHPEALVITPLLFAWWFATRRRWRAVFVALVLALATREDTALAVFVMGLVLWWMLRGDASATRRDRRMALIVAALGVVWYVVAMRLVIPAFNRWEEPFYVEYFYGHYGSDTVEVVSTILTRPDRVVSDATQPDRLRFYRDLLVPWGGLPLASPLQLLMAAPQMVASVIGLSPYARSIRYQYTSIMIAPIVIAAIYGAERLWRFRVSRRVLVPWMLAFAYVSNIAWSPSPISANDQVWATPRERHAVLREALELVPDDASVTATFALVPHLSHRDEIYDWPNPWVPSYWGNNDTYRLPNPSEIDYVVLDTFHVGEAQQELLDQLVGPDGEFEVLLDRDGVVVGRRPQAG